MNQLELASSIPAPVRAVQLDTTAEDAALLLELDSDTESIASGAGLPVECLGSSSETEPTGGARKHLAPSLRDSIRSKHTAAQGAVRRARGARPPSLRLHILACDALAAALRFEDGETVAALSSQEWASLRSTAACVFDEAERLKHTAGVPPSESTAAAQTATAQQSPSPHMPRLAADAGSAGPPLQASLPSLPRAGASSLLTSVEKRVLGRSSTINGREYLPWCATVDPGDAARFPVGWDPSAAHSQCPDLFQDPHGLMHLSVSQRKRFARWMRPADIVKQGGNVLKLPVVVAASGVDADRVRQQCVPDCSVIASLCIAARFEQTHKQPLISGVIYPQDASGRPVFNTYGRYLVRLFFNGCFRRVEIDDLLPVDKHGLPLCAHSSDPTEFWPALLEKAYLKMCNGGYHFPGSNSSIDMHAFTGWLPERFDLKDDQALHEGRVWPRLHSAMLSGDCLATVGTGSMSSSDEERTGLVSGHAYAVLSVHEIPRSSEGSAAASPGHMNDTLKLVRLKNPWAKTVWKGRFSPSDTGSWTPQLQGLLGAGAGTQHRDDGTFFIDFKALCHAFERLYMAWSPQLFAHRQVLHGHWAAAAPGPVDDRYNISHNPQFLLDVQVPNKGEQYKCALWLLLTRHVTQRDADDEDAASISRPAGAGAASEPSTPYLSLQLHSKSSFGQQCILLPGAPQAAASIWASGTRNVFLSGPAEMATSYSANPHILLRHDLPPGHHQLTAVISQLKRARDVDYTLRAWCMEPCSLRSPSSALGQPRVVSGAWAPNEQGGRFSNRCIRLQVPSACSVFLELQASKDNAVKFELLHASVRSSGSQGIGQSDSADNEEAHQVGDAATPASQLDDAVSVGASTAASNSGPSAEITAGASSIKAVPSTASGGAKPQGLICSSGSWRKCYTAKTVLGITMGEYELRVQCLPPQASAAAELPFLCSCRMLQDSAAASMLVAGCQLQLL